MVNVLQNLTGWPGLLVLFGSIVKGVVRLNLLYGIDQSCQIPEFLPITNRQCEYLNPKVLRK